MFFALTTAFLSQNNTPDNHQSNTDTRWVVSRISEQKFGVPKVPKIWISANQEIRVQDIRESGYQEIKLTW